MKKQCIVFGAGLLMLLAPSPGAGQASRPQATAYVPPAEFAPLARYFEERRVTFQAEEQPLPLPLVFREDGARVGMNYQLRFGAKPLGLSKREAVLRNPFAAAAFPLAYSVIYQNHLLVLFEPGYFACYRLPSLARNQQLEQQLNTRKSEYFWLLNNQLVALTGGQHYVFNNTGTWEPYGQAVPIPGKMPKLFEDERYLAFLTCKGEWGGEVFFFDKQTRRYYRTGATCPNSITRRDGQYYVLASLGHGGGSMRLQAVANPAKLTPASFSFGQQLLGAAAADMADEPPVQRLPMAPQQVFYYYGIQCFASFPWRNQQLYLVDWAGRTFLSTIQHDTISIADPAFNRSLYTHQPIATSYGPDQVLINLDFYGLGGEREVGCLLLNGDELLRVDWDRKRDPRY